MSHERESHRLNAGSGVSDRHEAASESGGNPQPRDECPPAAGTPLLAPLQDLGDLGVEPLLVFGGPYSNLAALQTLRERAEALGVPPARVICTGDIVAYCADPQACVDLVRDWGCVVVMGNCEESLAEGAADCGCGFASGTACDVLSASWFRFATQRVSPAQRAWMAGLPRRLAFVSGGLRVAVVHGSATSINRFVFCSDSLPAKQRELDLCGSDVLVGGHCGLPFVQPLSRGFWLNSGALGMPANDGTPDGWYAVLKPCGERRLEVRLERLAYPWRESQARMRAVGLDTPYAAALESGLWPSLDVLPASEREQTGRSLRFDPTILGI